METFALQPRVLKDAAAAFDAGAAALTRYAVDLIAARGEAQVAIDWWRQGLAEAHAAQDASTDSRTSFAARTWQPCTPTPGLATQRAAASKLDNAYAALEHGVVRFDTSIGGLGGSPFAHGAGGNLATEALVALLDDLGIVTGIAIEPLVEAALLVESLVGRPVPSVVEFPSRPVTLDPGSVTSCTSATTAFTHVASARTSTKMRWWRGRWRRRAPTTTADAYASIIGNPSYRG